jgi:hypothetical protein
MPKSEKSPKKPESLIVETLHETHPRIRAADWRSPLARRLLGSDKYADGEAKLNVSFKSKQQKTVQKATNCRWRGLRADFNACVKTYQAPVITEFATLGMACLLTADLLNSQITEVTRRGDRADYWIGDRDYLLEASGQQKGNLETLHDEKTQQLRENPFQKSGFVCVANYEQKKVRYWYHEYAE